MSNKNTINFEIQQGATFRRVLTFKDQEGGLIDLTGNTFRGQARANVLDASPVFSFSFTIENQVTNRGQVIMELDDTTSSAVPVTEARTVFVYDVERVVGTDVFRVLEGRIMFSAEVTR